MAKTINERICRSNQRATSSPFGSTEQNRAKDREEAQPFLRRCYIDVRRFQPMTDFALFFPRRRIFFRQSGLGRLETGKRKSRDFNGLVYRGETAFGDPRQGICRFGPKLRVRFSCRDCKDSRYNREWTERTPPESGTSSPSSLGMGHFRL